MKTGHPDPTRSLVASAIGKPLPPPLTAEQALAAVEPLALATLRENGDFVCCRTDTGAPTDRKDASVPTDQQSCIALEDERPLTRAEKARGWYARPFWGYDLTRLCRACQAYWHLSSAANVLREMVHWKQVLAAEAERKAKDAAIAAGKEK